MNKLKELIQKLKTEYEKINPTAREIIETVVFVVVMVIIIIWISAIASVFIDNIPFAATMIPVITAMAATQNIELATLAWALSLGTDLGGNATPIGASANVMGISVAAKSGNKITWGKYCRYCAPATILVVLISTVYIILRYL